MKLENMNMTFSNIAEHMHKVQADITLGDWATVVWLTAENSWHSGSWIDAVAKRVGELDRG